MEGFLHFVMNTKEQSQWELSDQFCAKKVSMKMTALLLYIYLYISYVWNVGRLLTLLQTKNDGIQRVGVILQKKTTNTVIYSNDNTEI
jgi:hypothetical protein